MNVPVLERTFNEIVRRHEILRSSFSQIGIEPLQLIADFVELPVAVTDLSMIPENERELQMEGICSEQATRGFDVADGPLLRVELVRMHDERHILALTLHNLVSDGWSIRLIMEEMQQIYTAFLKGCSSPLAPPAIQYVDYVMWQQEWIASPEVGRQLPYWRSKLANYRRLEVPGDFPRPAEQTANSAILSLQLRTTLTDGLKDVSSKLGGTMFTTALAACIALLHRITRETDIAIGSPIAGRDRTETEGLIGLFANPVIFRTQVIGDSNFQDFALYVRETVWEAMANQEIPFAHVVKALRDNGELCRDPFYGINFVCQRAFGGSTDVEFSGLRVSAIPSKATGSLYDLSFLLHRVIEWVDFSQNFESPAAVVVSLWACGQRACVVHHVHSGADTVDRGTAGC